jgi:hypothetical protein
MALDIDELAPEARERYHALGSQYATPNVLAQADRTRAALAKHRAALAPHGFGDEDEQELVEGHTLLRAEELGYVQAESARRVTGLTYADARWNAGEERKSSRVLLKRAYRKLHDKKQFEPARMVESALIDTRRLSADKALPGQLETLRTALSLPAVVAITAGRGGPETLQRLDTAYSDLQGVAAERAGHTPVTTASERRDILDGIVITLARAAYAAATQASRRLRQPSIAAEFELIHLRPSRSSGGATPPEPAE